MIFMVLLTAKFAHTFHACNVPILLCCLPSKQSSNAAMQITPFDIQSPHLETSPPSSSSAAAATTWTSSSSPTAPTATTTTCRRRTLSLLPHLILLWLGGVVYEECVERKRVWEDVVSDHGAADVHGVERDWLFALDCHLDCSERCVHLRRD